MSNYLVNSRSVLIGYSKTTGVFLFSIKLQLVQTKQKKSNFLSSSCHVSDPRPIVQLLHFYQYLHTKSNCSIIVDKEDLHTWINASTF